MRARAVGAKKVVDLGPMLSELERAYDDGVAQVRRRYGG